MGSMLSTTVYLSSLKKIHRGISRYSRQFTLACLSAKQ
jgi:hypothetical protein